MIKIAPEKWGYFNQIIFNANKMAFEACLSQAPTILGHIVTRSSALLG